MDGFEITSVYAGWFEFKFRNHGNEILLSCSNIFSYDISLSLLKTINEMFCQETCIKSICCMDEMSAYILKFLKHSHEIQITVGEAYKSSDKISNNPEALENESIKKRMFEGIYVFKEFADSIFKAFESYSSGENLNIYQKQWMPFPQEDFVKLRNKMLYRYPNTVI